MYVHHTIIKAETYLEYITGKHYDLKRPDQFQELTEILAETGNGDCWDYPLNELDQIMLECFPGIVLVDIYGTTIDNQTAHHVYRWFALPADDPEAIKEAFAKGAALAVSVFLLWKQNEKGE